MNYIDVLSNYTAARLYFHRTLDSFGAQINQGYFNEYS